MTAQPVAAPRAACRPLDPNSDRGRQATAALAQIFAGVELRKARKALSTHSSTP